MLDILKQSNWIDILIVCILARVIYIGFKNGIIVEFFKLLGSLFAIFISFHYYIRLSELIQKVTFFSEDVCNSIAFGVLFLVILLIFMLTRDGFMLVVKIQMNTFVDRWAGGLLSIVRAFLLASVLLNYFQIAAPKEIRDQLQSSVTFHSFFGIAPSTYQCFFEIFNKLCPDEKINAKILTIKTRDVKTFNSP